MVFGFLSRLSTSRSDRRSEPRGLRVTGQISLDGHDYPLKDWSRRGFSASRYRAEHYPGDTIEMTVRIELGDDPLVFACQAVVVWVDRDRRELAGVFTRLDTRIQEKIMSEVFARATRKQDGASESAREDSALHV